MTASYQVAPAPCELTAGAAVPGGSGRLALTGHGDSADAGGLTKLVRLAEPQEANTR